MAQELGRPLFKYDLQQLINPFRPDGQATMRFARGSRSTTCLQMWHIRETAVALAHCSSWSADRIRLVLEDLAGVITTAENIWDEYKDWVEQESTTPISAQVLEIMARVCSHAGFQVDLANMPATLLQRPRPITVIFPRFWSSRGADNPPLLPGYNGSFRTYTMSYLHLYIWEGEVKLQEMIALPINAEERFIGPFGPIVSALLKQTLRQWSEAMHLLFSTESVFASSENAKVTRQAQVDLINQFGLRFVTKYETVFGLMEPRQRDYAGHDDETRIRRITSTADGAALLLSIMMTDRLEVTYNIRTTRKQSRFMIPSVNPALLSSDSVDCPICLDALGVPVPTDTGAKATETIEYPVRTNTCCRQIIGAECLRRWCHPAAVPTCPLCRSEFPAMAMVNLFGSRGNERVWRDQLFWQELVPNRAQEGWVDDTTVNGREHDGLGLSDVEGEDGHDEHEQVGASGARDLGAMAWR